MLDRLFQFEEVDDLLSAVAIVRIAVENADPAGLTLGQQGARRDDQAIELRYPEASS